VFLDSWAVKMGRTGIASMCANTLPSPRVFANKKHPAHLCIAGSASLNRNDVTKIPVKAKLLSYLAQKRMTTLFVLHF